MDTRLIAVRTTSIVAIAGIILGAGVKPRAFAQSDERAARAQTRAIEGVWEPVVTIRDCQTQTVLVRFLSVDIYTRGGGLLAESSSPPAVRATGLGAWRHLEGRNYSSVYQFFTYNPDGTPAGRL